MTRLVVSGHRIDGPDRASTGARFPAPAERRVASALADAMASLHIGPGDTVVVQGADGTDIIAGELAVLAGARVEILLPAAPHDFVEHSVADSWRQRFRALRTHCDTLVETPPAGANPYDFNNRRALTSGADHALAVWDGAPGPVGGTSTFIDLARAAGVPLTVVEPATAWRTPNVPYWERQSVPGPKRLLALDGGGLRGIISLEVLARIEQLLGGDDPEFRLCDWFDYIAGTSTGAIIATALACGHRVSTIQALYRELGPQIFHPQMMAKRWRSRYVAGPLTDRLRTFFGDDLTLGDDRLRTLLLIVLHRIDTDSVWPLSNNTRALYNNRALDDCNLDVPLWKIIRGSAAAPVYFPPEKIRLGRREGVFEDGGVTPYNNPALMLFQMATAPQYQLGWATGHENLLLVSVGTGHSPATHDDLDVGGVHLGFHAKNLVRVLTNGAMAENDRLCRSLGVTRFAGPLDSEFDGGPVPTAGLFSYARYSPQLTIAGLQALGVGHLDPARVSRLDAVDSLDQLAELGRAVATQVEPAHLAGFS